MFYTRQLHTAPEQAARCAAFPSAASLLVTSQVQQEPPGEPDCSLAAPQLLWALLSQQADHTCDLSGSYRADKVLLPPSIWAWNAKLWLKHLKKPRKEGAAVGIEGVNSMGILRAAEAVSIHIPIQVSQNKNVELACMQYQKNLCAVRCPQESLHIWHLGVVGTSNGCGHLSSIQHFTVLHSLPSPSLALKLSRN